MIEAREILCSMNPQGSKLMTMFWRYPKFLHQESLRHRTLYIHDCLYDPDFSFSVSSARAIPFSKLIDEVLNPSLRAKPEVWGAEQKGMSPGGLLTDAALQVAQNHWNNAARDAARNALAMAKAEGLADAMPWDIPHKSIINRIIEPYIHVNCLVTGTDRGWMNFFGLRLDAAADPTLQVLAQKAWKVWNDSNPQKLQPGQWHLPYVNSDDNIEIEQLEMHLETNGEKPLSYIEYCTRISAARCARLSYLSFETNKRSTIEEDLKLYDRLVGSSPIHASPCEHQATPDNPGGPTCDDSNHCMDCGSLVWENIDKSGNFDPGWIQYRHMLPNQAIAPLPKEYQNAN